MTMRAAVHRRNPTAVRTVFNEPEVENVAVYGGVAFPDLYIARGTTRLSRGNTDFIREEVETTSLACHIVAKPSHTYVKDTLISVVRFTGFFPINADLKEHDVITRVTNRKGEELYDQRFRVKAPLKKRRHLEATLEQYR